jgi:tetratricopeptide (TPR) repeat protein
MKYMFTLTLLIALIAAVSAQTQSLSDIERAYNVGEYENAITLGHQNASAQALVLAARSRLAMIDLGQSDQRKTDAKAALKDAEAAIDLDPENAEAYLMKVAALGMLARHMSKLKSFRKGIAPKSRRLLDEAQRLDPQSAWAQAMMGMWHLEILRRGGAFGARVTGASASEGAKDCGKIQQSTTFDIGMGVQCGLALLHTDGFEDQAVTILRQTYKADDTDIAYDRAMKERAVEILGILDTKGLKAARKRALYYLNGKASK